MIDLNEIHSLTDFQRNTKEYIGRLKESGKPFVLTVNGKAEVVVQDAASYQKTLELIEWAETIAGIERGLDDVKHGRTKSIDQFAQQMESKYDIRGKKKVMEYRVEITENAHTETDEAYFWLNEASPDAALRLYDGLLDSFRSLAHLPERCSIAPESKWFGREIRQLLYGKYRILFSIDEDVVYVLHVRHSARDYIRSSDIIMPVEE